MAGYKKTDGGCVACEVGQYKDVNSDDTSCTVCSASGLVTTVDVGANDRSLCGEVLLFTTYLF